MDFLGREKYQINKHNNNTNTGKLALKLQNILLSFIIEYTKPESSEHHYLSNQHFQEVQQETKCLKMR